MTRRFTRPRLIRPLPKEEEEIKPLLRGWLHAGAALAAVGLTMFFLIQTADDAVRFVSLLIYGLSMILLYAVSATYHIGAWDQRRASLLRAWDHANIYLMIAGTYTPFCVNILTGWTQKLVLGLIWTLGLAGAIGTVVSLHLPRWIQVALYIGMGWVAVFTFPQLAHLLPPGAIALVLAGGLCYTIGAVIYALQRPNPLPHYFGFHELFHLMTIAGGAAFLIAIWRWVLPGATGL
ncbi:PAQR family membrane homeostasis protein TrhA [Kallotenue papyrolyticum]|uniref:PAQR family membrane homeostasis protein TrhA n=1 Tax=Kallotenue papyrolyticum TaxID=1325125 RepID=UPI000492DDE3|nr:hemolysin III family protein [Kallotenue papyrolyticum]